MPNTFKDEEYADMHFVYYLCNGTGRATVVEYWQRHLLLTTRHHKIFENVQRTLRETGFFP
jgi:hypothetical protein